MRATVPFPAAEVIPVPTKDGLRLALHRLGDSSCPPVLLLPGAFSNHTFWLGTRGVGLARYLAGQGFCTFSLDFRGHGLAQPKPAGHRWCFEDWARFDIPAAVATAATEGTVRVVSHSAAGAAALTALALHPELRHHMAALIILATPAPRLAGFRRLATHMAIALCELLGRFPARALGLGPEDEDGGIMGQWLHWNLQGQWRTQSGKNVLAELPELPFPVLVVAGRGDWLWAPPQHCEQLFHQLPTARKAFRVLGNEVRCGLKPGHVSLVTSRLSRRNFWPELASWLAAAKG